MNARNLIDGPLATITVESILDLEAKIEADKRATAEDEQNLAAMYRLARLTPEALETARRQRKGASAPVFQPSPGIPVLPHQATHPALVFDENAVTMQGSVLRTLKAHNGGMTHSDLRDSLQDIEMLKAKWGDGYSIPFYKAVANCVARGVVRKYKGRLYASEVLEKLLAEGVHLGEQPIRAIPRNGTGWAVLKILENGPPEGMAANKIREKLLEDPNTVSSLRVHPHYIYNTMTTLEKRGQVVKDSDSDKYRLLSKKAKG